jgi:hypothetical protein
VTIFEYCRKWIEDALEYSGGSHVFEDVVEGITSGRMQLWPAERGCAVTEIVVFPRKKVLNCFLAGGEMDAITDMLDAAKDWGRAQGCVGLTLAGRPGWERVLRDKGFKKTMTVLEVEI